MSLSGQKYSIGQIQQLLRQAGWPDIVVTEADGDTIPLIVLMSAIAMPESGGYACAHNEAAENSWGLLQVSLRAHPEYTSAQMCDPITNLRAAYAVYLARGGGQNGLNAWGPYQTGIYAPYIDAAYAAYGGQGNNVTNTGSVKQILNGVAPTDTSGDDSSGGSQDVLYIVAAGLAALVFFSRFRQ